MTPRRRRLLLNTVLTILLLVGLAAGALLLLRPASTSAASATTRIVAVSTGTATSTATADGTVEAADEVAANFATSGSIDSISVAVGDVVTKGEVLATLDAEDAKREADVADLAVGQAATLTFPGLDDATGTGKVTAIAPTGTSTSGVVTYATTVKITEHPDELRLGQSASVGITTAEATDVTVVPSVAVTTTGDRSTVTVVDGDQQVLTPVEVGVVGADLTEVTSGVEVGQQVVLTSATATEDDSDQSQFGPGGAGFPGGGAPPAGVTGGGR